MSKAKPGWYVVDHAHEDHVMRGPYLFAETAEAVRDEIERHCGR